MVEGCTRRVARKTVCVGVGEGRRVGERHWHIFSLAFPNGLPLTMATIINTVSGQTIPKDGCPVSVSFSSGIGKRRRQVSSQRCAKEKHVFQQLQQCCRRLLRDAWLTGSPPRVLTLLLLFPPSFPKLPWLLAGWNIQTEPTRLGWTLSACGNLLGALPWVPRTPGLSGRKSVGPWSSVFPVSPPRSHAQHKAPIVSWGTVAPQYYAGCSS